MRQAVFIKPGQLEWRDVPAPTLEGNCDALVRPLVVGRCDLDALYVAGRMPLASGEPIGHEIIGEIVSLGANVPSLSIGQRVIVSAQISCGTCGRCVAGFTGRCEKVPFGASYGMGRVGNFGGGLADLIRVPFASAMLVPIPDVDPRTMIGLADMSTDAWRAIAPPLQQRPWARVLVLGGATPVIGIYAAGMAVTLGAVHVDYVDANAEHRQLAANYGAQVAAHIDDCSPGDFDIVVDASGDATRLLSSLERIAPEAFITSVAPAPIGPPFPLREMYMKGATYHVGRPNCRAGHEGVLQAWREHGFDAHRIQPKIFSFDAACEAWCDGAPYVAVSRLD